MSKQLILHPPFKASAHLKLAKPDNSQKAKNLDKILIFLYAFLRSFQRPISIICNIESAFFEHLFLREEGYERDIFAYFLGIW